MEQIGIEEQTKKVTLEEWLDCIQPKKSDIFIVRYIVFSVLYTLI